VPGPEITARERRTIRLGLLVTLVALGLVWGVLPFARRWRAREDVIATESERLARLHGLVANEDSLRVLTLQRAAALEEGPRLLAGRTPALAASELQSVLQNYANQSLLTVSGLDVTGAPETSEGALTLIPATVSAIGDIHGITDMLTLIQDGPVMLEVSELTVRPNPALRGELLQMTVTLRGAWMPDVPPRGSP
jgi:hypothetical protein